MNVRTKPSPVEAANRLMRAAYLRWRAKHAEVDAEMLRAAAARNLREAQAAERAALEWRDRAWRIERGVA